LSVKNKTDERIIYNEQDGVLFLLAQITTINELAELLLNMLEL